MAIGCQAIGSRVVRIEFDGATEQAERLLDVVEGQRIVQRERAEEEIVGVNIVRRLAARALDLCTAKFWLDCAYDARGDAVLKIEDVTQGPVETIGPEMQASRSIEQLTGDAHALARPAHAALEQVAHAEACPDFLGFDYLALENKT